MRTALVTGGARGFGACVARALRGAGYLVCVNYLSAPDAEALGAAGPGGLAIRADVRDRGAVARMIAEIEARWGRLDVLVNNAAIIRDSLLVRTAPEDWDQVVGTALTGAYNVSRAALPMMGRAGGGHIVHVASRSGLRGNRGQAAYSAAKAALVGLTRSMALELGAVGIRVNAVAPGYMDTPMGRANPEAMQRARAASPLGRLTDAEEAASFVLWLVGTVGVTGQVFGIDSRPTGQAGMGPQPL